MSQDQRTDTAPAAPPASPDAREFYAEPPAMTRRDAWGVAAALASLVLIGASGYIWLNPELSFESMLRRPSAAETAQPAERSSRDSVASAPRQTPGAPVAGPGNAPAAEAAAANPLREPHAHAHDLSCPHCGMYSDRSLAHSVVLWTDGSHTHHDCWDCAFAWGREHSLTLERAVVTQHAAAADNPAWLPAETAFYLYDTQPLTGSMPPYVAAFAGRTAAVAAQNGLGGELVDWTGLQAKFNNGDGGGAMPSS